MNSKSYVFIGMGVELVGAVVVLLWAGGIVDHEYGTKGLGAVGGIVIAFVGWITHLLYVVRKLAKDEKSVDTSGQ